MTTFEEPHLGWHTVGWGGLRRWWVHRSEHKTGEFNKNHGWYHRAEFEDDGAEDEPAHSAPEVGETAPEDAPPSRWESLAQDARTVGIWCAAAVCAVVLVDPAPWFLALVIGAAGATIVLQRAAHQRAVEVLAYQVERERSDLEAQRQRKQRRDVNKTAHAAERAAQFEEARAAREARKAANREGYRGSEEP